MAERVMVAVLCGVLALGLGCRSLQIDIQPGATPTAAAAAATSTPLRASTASPTATTRPAAATSTPALVSTPSPTAASGPAASPSAEFQIELDGQAVTADTLPRPEAYYADVLAKHGKDFSTCRAGPSPQARACPKPESLGSLDLKPQINVELILDASGSMAGALGGETKLATAQRVLSEFMTTLPQNANVALRVYGHHGSSAEADKAASCATSELLYPFQPLESARFESAIRSFQPSGWTPLAASLDAAAHDFEQFDPATSSNFVYVVTDGVETCDGDPVASARTLHSSNVQPIVNIVGFDIDPEAAEQLQQAAAAGGGQFATARNSDELTRVFKTNFNWLEWTRYYNCVYLGAYQQYGQVEHDQALSYACYERFGSEEQVEMTNAVQFRFGEIQRATILGVNRLVQHGTTLQAAEAGRDALLQRAAENRDYALSQIDQRHAAIVDAAAKQRAEVLLQAEADRDRAIREAGELSQSHTP